jgi:hypothetical protein
MTINFLEENGYPMTLHVETSECKEDGALSSFISVVTDINDIEIARFKHSDLRSRIHWVEGFYAALNFMHGV